MKKSGVWTKDLLLQETAHLVGQTFNVATSEHSCSKATGYWSDFLFRTSAVALRGAEKSGHIAIVEKFWRGARITRLK